MANNSSTTAAAARVQATITPPANTPAGSFTTTLKQFRRTQQQVSPEPDPFSEIGTSGLRQYGGYVLEEWLGQLHGRKASWMYREMIDNSPVIGAILFAIEWMARSTTWSVETGNDDAAAEFVEENMHDMEQPWGDFIAEALSMLGYGYSFHETVFKRRQGRARRLPAIDDPTAATQEATELPASSQYSDGKIGWRRLPGRAQETLLRWEFAGYSTVTAFVQIDWHGGFHTIPVSKGMLFRSRPRRNNPEGYSILRPAVVPFIRMKTIEQIEAIGIERDLAGIPVMSPPPDVDLWAPNNVDLLARAQQMVTSIRRDEFEGIVKPSPLWELELMSSGGSRQIDTDAIIRRYEVQIATTMLADFLKLGQNAVGSFALADVKTDMFATALDGIMDLICEVLNAQAVIPLLEINGMDVSDPPRITHSSATQMDLEKVGNFLYNLSGSGAPIPWSKPLLELLFDEAGLPMNFDEDVKEPVPVVEGQENVPVGPPKLSPGGDPWAREAHLEPAAEAAAAAAAAPAPTAVKKADGPTPERPRVQELPQGTVHRIDSTLRDRQQILSIQLEHEIDRALAELGTQASTAFLSIAQKADQPKSRKDGNPHNQSLVAAVLRGMRFRQWYENRFAPLFKNHASRVIGDTNRTVSSEIGLQVGVPDDQAERIIDLSGTTGLGLKDIELQARQAILLAVKAGQQAGEHPAQIATRIRQQVPAGRFVNAGAGYRSRLIARTETATLQKNAITAAYKSNPRIGHVEISDGVLADSDADCQARDGDVVPIGDADSITLLHPNCSLSLNPVVAAPAVDQNLPAPELITI